MIDADHVLRQIRKVLFERVNNKISIEECYVKIFSVFSEIGLGFDECQQCMGTKGGVPGNENVNSDGQVICDYCSSKEWDKE